MKLVKFIISFICVAVMSNYSLCSESSSKSKTSMRIKSLEKLLFDYQNFNKKAENVKKDQFGISNDALEREAHTLDLKYGDLLNIFLEKGSESKSADKNKNK